MSHVQVSPRQRKGPQTASTDQYDRIRRVKCDEGRPACHKCVSTGRKCDGYGIWGGGSNTPTHLTDGRLALKRNPFPLFVDAPGEDEHCCFEWFRSRTAKKIPGPFEPVFWETVVLGASFEEPAVLHAVLALGLAHKKESLEGDSQDVATDSPDEEEQFILRHYSESIRQLAPHFVNQSRSSIRVALIACMVFVCLEFIRGRYRTGNEHLKNGMKLLGQLAGQSVAIDLKAPRDPADTWLLETFAKLNLQSNLLGQGTRFLHQVQQGLDMYPLPVLFKTMGDARKRLDWLQHEIGQLAGEREHCSEASPQPLQVMACRQQLLLTQLIAWKHVCDVSRSSLLASMGPIGRIMYTILQLYYHMAFIMASTCLADTENVFDQHTNDFLEIVDQAIALHQCIASDCLGDSPFAHRPDVAPFTSDKGWIPPLYFTAIKCRAHRIRLHAVRLLSTIPSKEGIWDAQLAATIGAEVMRLEEQVLDPTLKNKDNFAPHSAPSADEARSCFAPCESRLRHVQVTLPNGRHDKTFIRCIPGTRYTANDAILREYNPIQKAWQDVPGSANVPIG
ncbi:uncharacterized protein J7T54_005320 [Emericellopsis cladophorae]|uniref:Zn(2)-C6 fungal-type domain-containing protein n=1 Tax=Emericellopsis cladophorae TaxID=2686198 RepID=A0A9Q0BEU8_9HYPO|nr:uncharacterized protein J7T54_005320 [Emericellopsis cladophorae]KAI6781609.1 hypothetical protein J7T54_005320 [Emericellopsis cladophorae]